MIEAYLRANKLFVDYNEVIIDLFLELFLGFFCSQLFIWEKWWTFELSSLKLLQPTVDKKYSSYIELDLASVEPSVSGPKR